MIFKKNEYKGILLYNDSLVITSNCFLFDDKNLLIKDISPPFYFRKKANNDSILITKNSDSLYFKFISMD
jgi:hypothetical protein